MWECCFDHLVVRHTGIVSQYAVQAITAMTANHMHYAVSDMMDQIRTAVSLCRFAIRPISTLLAQSSALLWLM